MGILSRWDNSNQQTMETRSDVARDGVKVAPAAKAILFVAVGGCLLVMLIIAGSLILDPDDREPFLAANADVVALARQVSGCLDFVQAADPLDAGRINVFERWDSEEHLLAFRGAGQPASDSPPIRSAEVKRYVISAVEEP